MIIEPEPNGHHASGRDSGEELMSHLALIVGRLVIANEPKDGSNMKTARAAWQAAQQTLATLHDLRIRMIEIEASARSDGLTGVLNRQSFEATFAGIMANARRYRERGVIAFIDLDGLKAVNDTHGHAAGDALLRETGRLLSTQIRESDIVGRMGGDEFAVVLSRTRPREGIARARKLEAALNASSVLWQGIDLSIRASFGIQAYGPDDAANAIMARADHAMYRRKRRRGTGRDTAKPTSTLEILVPTPT